MRIIAGTYKGRTIHSDTKNDFRPTMSKTREALFSIVTSGQFLNEDGESILEEAEIADICCGTGAIGLEALSRGAKHVIFIDNDPKQLQWVQLNLQHFKAEDKGTIVRSDAAQLPKCFRPVTLAFIDPPYHLNIAPTILISLDKMGWLQPNAVVVVEMDSKKKLAVPDGFEEIDIRMYGKSQLIFLRYSRQQA